MLCRRLVLRAQHVSYCTFSSNYGGFLRSFAQVAHEGETDTTLNEARTNTTEDDEGEDDKEVEMAATNDYKMEYPLENLAKFRIGSIVVPSELRQLISSALKDVNRKELKKNVADLIASLRGRMEAKLPRDPLGGLKLPEEQKANINYTKDISLAYVADRVPGAYACNYRVFDEIAKRLPAFEPTSLLDYGSGPGTSIWAAKEVWPAKLKRIMAVEPSAPMTDIASTLLTGLPVRWQRYMPHSENASYDMVTCSYVLAELNTDKSRRQLIRSLWKQVEPGGIMVLIEHGSPLSFRTLRQIRTMLIEMDDDTRLTSNGAPKIIAPCPHEGACPMGNNSWCHFAQRVVHTPLQLAAKPDASVNFDTEKFSYLVVMKQPLAPNKLPNYIGDKYDEDDPLWKKWSRMVREPLKKSGHVILDACTPTGQLQRAIIARSHGRVVYKEARKTSWGDGFLINEDAYTKDSIFSRTGKKASEDNDTNGDANDPNTAHDQQIGSVKERINSGTKDKPKENSKSSDDKWVDDLSPETKKIIKTALEAGKQAASHATHLASHVTEEISTTPKNDGKQSGAISWAMELLSTSSTPKNIEPGSTWLEGFYDTPKGVLDKAKKDDMDLQKELEIEKGKRRKERHIGEKLKADKQ